MKTTEPKQNEKVIRVTKEMVTETIEPYEKAAMDTDEGLALNETDSNADDFNDLSDLTEEELEELKQVQLEPEFDISKISLKEIILTHKRGFAVLLVAIIASLILPKIYPLVGTDYLWNFIIYLGITGFCLPFLMYFLLSLFSKKEKKGTDELL